MFAEINQQTLPRGHHTEALTDIFLKKTDTCMHAHTYTNIHKYLHMLTNTT